MLVNRGFNPHIHIVIHIFEVKCMCIKSKIFDFFVKKGKIKIRLHNILLNKFVTIFNSLFYDLS